jgi:hypothetical protein
MVHSQLCRKFTRTFDVNSKNSLVELKRIIDILQGNFTEKG